MTINDTASGHKNTKVETKFERWFPPLGMTFIFVCAIFLVNYLLDKQKDDWNTQVRNITQYHEVVIPRKFVTWTQDRLLADGSIEHWSGKDAIVLFIDYDPHCEPNLTFSDLPCWTVYAQTKNTGRFFTVEAKVKREKGQAWRIEMMPELYEMSRAGVMSKALEQGRNEVVKRLAVAKSDA